MTTPTSSSSPTVTHKKKILRQLRCTTNWRPPDVAYVIRRSCTYVLQIQHLWELLGAAATFAHTYPILAQSDNPRLSYSNFTIENSGSVPTPSSWISRFYVNDFQSLRGSCELILISVPNWNFRKANNLRLIYLRRYDGPNRIVGYTWFSEESVLSYTSNTYQMLLRFETTANESQKLKPM